MRDKPLTHTLFDFGGFIGTSPVMSRLYEQIESVARSPAPVFITGEMGTGKSVCAEALHKYGPRRGCPFVRINCANPSPEAIEAELFGQARGVFPSAAQTREGAIHKARGGTLFLDDIAEMGFDAQTRLLRFFQGFTFTKTGDTACEKANIRLVCATGSNPIADIKAGRFRKDLFYRLHVLPLHMPSLRERGEDVVDIAYLLMKHYAAEDHKSFTALTPDAEELLRHYRWPGNIRQLQNVIRHAVVVNDGAVLNEDFLAATLALNSGYEERHPAPQGAFPDEGGPIRPLAETERQIIEKAIRLCKGNITKAAMFLGLSPSTIYRKKTAWRAERGTGRDIKDQNRES